jgi:N-dimethylarginine dimethylaminohydrolase
MSDFGAQSMTAALRRVVVRQPPDALPNADPKIWNYSAPINLKRAREDHAAFVALLQSNDVDVLILDDQGTKFPDSVFTHDASLVTTAGAVLMRMGKTLRRPEPDLHEAFYRKIGIPILGRIEPPGIMEAGDALWVRERTLILGRGYRTNDEGARQLARILAPLSVRVMPMDLPYGAGPHSCMHLLSLISLIAEDLALVHLPTAPVRLIQLLEEQGTHILPAPSAEYQSSNTISANVLAYAPRKVLMVAGFPKTRLALEQQGCTVTTFPGDELCLKAEGGPTCLTRPIFRC